MLTVNNIGFSIIEKEIQKIEFDESPIFITLSGRLHLDPPPFRDVKVNIHPDFIPLEIVNKIRNLIDKEFSLY